MKRYTHFSTTFEASHEADAGDHTGLHGHSWMLIIGFENEPTDQTSRTTARNLLAGLASELDGRHVNDQLPASVPTVQGIAAWAFERLSILIPGLAMVECSTLGESAIVER